MTGQILQDFEGEEHVAMADMVVLIPYIDGRQGKQHFSMTPEQAQALALALSTAAGQLISAEVDDAGKPTGLAHRIRRLAGN